ncbi:DUF1996 domain-containing protein [Streptomyces sp. NPDC057242]|uniref:DUF1996 domain-containing protein n=1 Tax=unclassified Streptomyces TaxID=2593676 RepID=UPI00364462AD
MRSATPGDFVNVNRFSFDNGTGGGTAPGWVGVDQAAWNARLARFRAMTPAAVPAGTVRVPEFDATCAHSHSKPDDPIVVPGLPGASHTHSFFGNRSTDAFTTAQSLRADRRTSCTPAEDLSAYWNPTLYEGGGTVESDGMIVHHGSRLPDPSVTVPSPQGFRMIAGNAESQVPTPAGSANQFFRAGEGGEIGRSADGDWPI